MYRVSLLFPPTRVAALERFAHFVPHAGRDYAAGRNSDFGPGAGNAVSMLSPYVRHRMITEEEIVASVLRRHGISAAEKFVQEVLWRTYWKGWLELRPEIWDRFESERDHARAHFPNSRAITAAENGMTGIEGFDDWARELTETGYLHNHARMWFASIWIFTLRLPWSLGADFFLRHLIDADAASNTLSWRWVAGLQTAGKTYLATADNIARNTRGRFAPKGLASQAAALTEAPVGRAMPLSEPEGFDAALPSLLLVTPEDLHPQSCLYGVPPIKAAIVAADPQLLWGDASRVFVRAAAADAAPRIASHFACPCDHAETLDADSLIAAAKASGVDQIVTPYAPVGPVASRINAATPLLAKQGIRLAQIRRRWDNQYWPHASKGFFPFKEKIPGLLREAGLL